MYSYSRSLFYISAIMYYAVLGYQLLIIAWHKLLTITSDYY